MDENLRQRLTFEANRKSAGVAYVLWFFLGGFGAHRFYMGTIGAGVTQLILLLLGWIPFFLGWLVLGIWLFVDLFLIPGTVRNKNMELVNMLGSGGAVVPAQRPAT